MENHTVNRLNKRSFIAILISGLLVMAITLSSCLSFDAPTATAPTPTTLALSPTSITDGSQTTTGGGSQPTTSGGNQTTTSGGNQTGTPDSSKASAAKAGLSIRTYLDSISRHDDLAAFNLLSEDYQKQYNSDFSTFSKAQRPVRKIDAIVISDIKVTGNSATAKVTFNLALNADAGSYPWPTGANTRTFTLKRSSDKGAWKIDNVE